ncbi:MAG TPA: outer membrane beta-barrel protein [Edaphobacter sp.]|nr:outer membrane beta-barrel protein [Edaphobacter sp.]
MNFILTFAYTLTPQEAIILKLHTLIGCFACVLGLTTLSHGQAIPTASRSGGLQIGGGLTYARPDYGRPVKGFTIYGNYDFTRHFGIEGDIHFANIITPDDIGETSYLLGPRYRRQYGRFTPYAKGMLGIGRFQYQYPSRWGHAYALTYKIYAVGGGVDLQATRHLNVRAFDFEYQGWPGYHTNGLTPIVMTVGVAYSFR